MFRWIIMIFLCLTSGACNVVKNSPGKNINFYDLPPLPLANEQFTDLLDTRDVHIGRIVSTGQASPPGFWYDQKQDEWVMVVQGQASVMVQEASGQVTHVLKAGDSLFLPAHRKHRVESTSKEPPTLWLVVFTRSS